jgi:hypothetical protein
MMRNLQVKLIQLDEQWDFIGKKQKRVRDNDPTRWAMSGSTWRCQPRTKPFSRMSSANARPRNRSPSDGFARTYPESFADHIRWHSPYVGAVTVGFQTGMDFAVLTKK